MATLTFVTVGGLKERYLTEAFAEYTKRLSSYVRVEEINLKEEPIKNEDNQKEIADALKREGERILARLPKDAYTIVLAVEGDAPTSEKLADKLASAIDSRGKITVVIGSSYGLSPEVKRAADYLFSMSRLTFPHQMCRVILAETLYRSLTILHGKRYHK